METSVRLSTIETSSALKLQPKVEADSDAQKSEATVLAAATAAARAHNKEKTQSPFEQLKQSIGKIEDSQMGNHNSLRFKVDSTTGKVTILVLNPEKNLIVRQIPQDITTRLPKNYSELAGLVVDIKV